MRTQRTIPILLLLFIAMLAACKKEKPQAPTPPPPANEEELITTVVLHFHDAGGTEHKHFTFRDLDGPGGDPPTIEADTLTAGAIYQVHVELLNETVSPPADITHEVEEEGTEHQLFYQFEGAAVNVTYDDADANGNPVGLHTVWAVGAASVGTVTVTLRHQPNKLAPGVQGGDITNAGGETDVEVVFPVVIQ